MNTDTQRENNNNNCFYYCNYLSSEADTAGILGMNIVPNIKPKKENECNLSPLKLQSSLYYDGDFKNQTDSEEQIRRFNIKRKTSKIISLSNASTSTDLPIIDLKNFKSIKTRRFSIGNPTHKISLKRINLKKKRSTILGGLIKLKCVGKINL